MPVNLTNAWRGLYSWNGHSLYIQSVHGFDVQVRLGDREIRAECKGGGQPSTQLASAIGQAIVCATGDTAEELWVAVPDTDRFEATAKCILSKSPALANAGIRIALVGITGVRLLNR